MKFTTIAALLVLALPFTASSEEQKARTIDELAARYDVSACKDCHETIFKE